MSVFLARRWRMQPQHPVLVNRGHPSARGLLVAIPYFRPVAPRPQYDAAGGKYPVIFGNTDVNATYWNTYTTNCIANLPGSGPIVGGRSQYNDQAYVFPAVGSEITASGEVSALVVLQSLSTDSGGNTGPFSVFNGGTNQYYPWTDNTITLGTFQTNSWISSVAVPEVSAFVPHTAVFTNKAGTQRYFVNGSLRASGVRGEAPGIHASTVLNILGGPNGKIFSLLVWNRFLNESEAVELSYSPWQLFAPLSTRIYSIPTRQYLRPVFDTTTAGWQPSTGSDLYAMVDEPVANNADYIYVNE